MTKATMERLGRLDILVNNAGTNIRKPVHDLTLDEWRLVLDTNLTSAFLCSRAAYPPMKRAGGGKLINIGPMISKFRAPLAPLSAATLGGTRRTARALAQ